MEQHPIPQNVTTFQFRLIGDMTVKQFGYLAGGLILAYISYKLPLPFFFTWPLAILFGLGGFGFAFVPVEERPMDVWVLSFLKNVYSPTQFLWQKQKKPSSAQASVGVKDAGTVLDVLSRRVATRKTMKTAPASPQQTPTPIQAGPVRVFAPRNPGFFSALAKLFQAPPMPAPAAPAAARPRGRTLLLSEWLVEPSQWIAALVKTFTPRKQAPPTPPGVFAPADTSGLTGKRMDVTSPPAQTPTAPSQEELEQKAALERRLVDLQTELATKTASDTRLKELQEQIAQVMSDKAKMEQELTELRQQLSASKAQPGVVRPAGVREEQAPSPTVRIVTPAAASKMGLPRLTTFPNVISGILKDSTGNLLSAILVTVRDKDDIPVRALKTNKIGQFASSLPLPNGTYTINIEDPREQYVFDRIALTLTGEVMPAVEVTAKNQKQVAREKLAAEIFGQPKM